MHTAEEKEYIRSKKIRSHDTFILNNMTGPLSKAQERKKAKLTGRVGKCDGIIEVYERNHPKNSKIVAKKYVQKTDNSNNTANIDVSKNYGCGNSIKFEKQPKSSKPTSKPGKAKKK